MIDKIKTMEYAWVLARYRSNSDRGKKVLELAEEGVGYKIINKERAKNEDIIVAFKFPMNKSLPLHLSFANESQIKKLEAMDKSKVKS